ncbi:MAG: FecR domain-containing protein [Leptospiraceae bacterium]|nr:FecR domain-containing protein [Leptospiraceae bacterium]
MSPLLKKVFTLSRNDQIILGISAAVLLIASIGLYFDLNRRSGGGSGKQVGILKIKNNVAQRKFNEQVIWENLENNIPVYNNDSIRTGELSAASIVLNDKTEIALDENSMIVLNIDEDAMNIDFVSGSIQANRSAVEGTDGDTAPELTIKSKDKVIEIDDSDIQLNKGDTEELVVDVKRGSASIKTEDGQEKQIKENERASLDESGKVEIKKITLIPVSPASGANIIQNAASSNVSFSWQALQDNQAATLEVSNRRFFAPVKVRATVPGSNFSARLDSGIWYWRISAINQQTKKREYSEVRSLSIVQNSPLKLHSPADQNSFEYVSDEPLVSFGWSANELAQGYTLEVARDAGFGSIVQSRNSNTTGMALTLPAGSYYWRVKTTSSLEGGSTTSATRQFQVVQRQKIAAPTPLQPGNSTAIPAAFFEKAGVTFSWKKPAEIQSTRLDLSNSSSFGRVIVSRSANGNFTRIQQALQPGTYYWRLQGTDSRGTATDYSAPASFQVGETEKLQLTSPANGEAFDEQGARDAGVVFRWQKPQIYAAYRLEIAPAQVFGPRTIRENSNSLSVTRRGLTRGTWYWRVSMMDGNTILSTSEVRSFKISDSFLPPVIQEPADGAVVDMTNRNALNFSWKKSAGAVYYQASIEYNNQKLYSARVNGTTWSIRKFDRLHKGQFRFVVAACRNSGEPLCTTERESSFQLTLQEPAVPQLEGDEEIFVIEDE